MNNREIRENPLNEGEFLLPCRRGMESEEKLEKKAKKLVVSYEEWEPYSKALKNLRFLEEGNLGNKKEAAEQYKLAMRMSSPEGLSEIISELEGKLSVLGDTPIDPIFEQLSLTEKIEKLYNEFASK